MSVTFRVSSLSALLAGLLLCGCASDEFSPTHDFTQKKPAPVPTAPPANERPPRAPQGAGKIDPDAPKEFTTTESGLKYRVMRKATGPRPASSDTVKVHYRGWLDSGREFDSSYARGEPISFPLTGVISGWTEGLQYCNQGGMIELEIPYQLGYGVNGSPPKIPPKATLHFTVELLEIR